MSPPPRLKSRAKEISRQRAATTEAPTKAGSRTSPPGRMDGSDRARPTVAETAIAPGRSSLRRQPVYTEPRRARSHPQMPRTRQSGSAQSAVVIIVIIGLPWAPDVPPEVKVAQPGRGLRQREPDSESDQEYREEDRAECRRYCRALRAVLLHAPPSNGGIRYHAPSSLSPIRGEGWGEGNGIN